MSGIIESIGQPGHDFGRYEGRAFSNVKHTVTDPQQLIAAYHEFAVQGMEQHHRHRVVFRARCSDAVFDYLLSTENAQSQLRSFCHSAWSILRALTQW